MKADGVLNLLKFQCFQSVRMTSGHVRYTMKRSVKHQIYGIMVLRRVDYLKYTMKIIPGVTICCRVKGQQSVTGCCSFR